jgi:hypothetical protein
LKPISSDSPDAALSAELREKMAKIPVKTSFLAIKKAGFLLSIIYAAAPHCSPDS